VNKPRPPILICYDGSPGAAQAITAAGTLCPGSPAIVLYIWSGAAAEHVHIPGDGTEAERRELAEDVRSAARREAAAVAGEGTRLAREAGLEARPLTVETEDGPADAIMQVAAKESTGAVVIGRTSRTRLGRLLPGSVSRRVIDHSPAPVVLV
jgi:nucleotide-binding universal stress UspA family protein